MTDKHDIPATEFDRFADEYQALMATAVSASGEAPGYFTEYKVIDIADVLRAAGRSLDGLRILDFGAGVGNAVPFFRTHFPDASITCVDVSSKSLEIGRGRFGDAASFVHFEGGALPFPDGSFDVVLVSCVLHHIDHALHPTVLSNIRRVLADGGRLFVYEHNALNPLTMRAVNTCPFDEHAVLLKPGALRRVLGGAGFSSVERRYRIFFPHFLRRLRFLETWLRWCPAGAQYAMIAKK